MIKLYFLMLLCIDRFYIVQLQTEESLFRIFQPAFL